MLDNRHTRQEKVASTALYKQLDTSLTNALDIHTGVLVRVYFSSNSFSMIAFGMLIDEEGLGYQLSRTEPEMVSGINDEDDGVRAPVVALPQRAVPRRARHVPRAERNATACKQISCNTH